MDRPFTQTVADLRMLLRDHPPCTTADVADGAVVYLDHGVDHGSGHDTLRGVFLLADERDGLDAPFAVDGWFTGQMTGSLADWFAAPHFTQRPALSQWALDAPLVEVAD